MISIRARSYILITTVAVPATAHHGFGNFDLKRNIELSGTIGRMEFINPHSWLYVNVVDANGAPVTYRCEMRGATVLRRSGWTPRPICSVMGAGLVQPWASCSAWRAAGGLHDG